MYMLRTSTVSGIVTLPRPDLAKGEGEDLIVDNKGHLWKLCTYRERGQKIEFLKSKKNNAGKVEKTRIN